MQICNRVAVVVVVVLVYLKLLYTTYVQNDLI